MPRYKVITPASPRVTLNGHTYPDFQQATIVGSIAHVRRLMEPHKFNGCGVWRYTDIPDRGHWSLIFDTTAEDSDYSDPPAAWERVEASQ